MDGVAWDLGGLFIHIVGKGDRDVHGLLYRMDEV
jgi:hypothetical protein